MAREPGDPLYEYEQQLIREEEAKRKADEARKARMQQTPPASMSTVDQILYDKAAKMFEDAVISGDPTATKENREAWIRTRMAGMRPRGFW